MPDFTVNLIQPTPLRSDLGSIGQLRIDSSSSPAPSAGRAGPLKRANSAPLLPSEPTERGDLTPTLTQSSEVEQLLKKILPTSDVSALSGAQSAAVLPLLQTLLQYVTAPPPPPSPASAQAAAAAAGLGNMPPLDHPLINSLAALLAKSSEGGTGLDANARPSPDSTIGSTDMLLDNFPHDYSNAALLVEPAKKAAKRKRNPSVASISPLIGSVDTDTDSQPAKRKPGRPPAVVESERYIDTEPAPSRSTSGKKAARAADPSAAATEKTTKGPKKFKFDPQGCSNCKTNLSIIWRKKKNGEAGAGKLCNRKSG